jgi:ABC-type nitrate/sulfonate/bicarbonate transport system ATPase subunit
VLEVFVRAKSYRLNDEAREILRDVSFRAAEGEIIALLGPSGIGKTTFLKIVLGLDRDFEGEVRGRPSRVGVVFQEPRLLPWLNIADNLRLVRPRLTEAEIEALCAEALLANVGALLPSQLSLGMARRVAFARALAIDPNMLVLDEPFASLDRGLAAALGNRLVMRARTRRALVLLSTHDLDGALAIAGRILVLAGAPATLAADFVVPSGRALSEVRADLLAEFAFLSGPEEDARESLPSPEPALWHAHNGPVR